MNEKLLFLPHCLKKNFVNKLKKEGEERGYKVFVVSGSSIIEKILSKYEEIERIVGIACEKEIKLALEYTAYLSKKDVKIETVRLSKDGCKNTEVDISEVLKSL